MNYAENNLDRDLGRLKRALINSKMYCINIIFRDVKIMHSCFIHLKYWCLSQLHRCVYKFCEIVEK